MTDQNSKQPPTNTARLKDVIAAYGADRANWPAADRDQFDVEALAAAEVQKDLLEAREVDALLGGATVPAADGAAAARITPYILEQPAGEADQNVIALATRQRRPVAGPKQTRRSTWSAATLIAASLVLGIALGRSAVWDDVATGILLGDDATFAELSDAVLGLQFNPDTFSEDL